MLLQTKLLNKLFYFNHQIERLFLSISGLNKYNTKRFIIFISLSFLLLSQVYRSVKFYYIVESRTVWPNLWRVVNLIHILLILAHWFGCFYFLLSEVEGFQVNVGWRSIEWIVDTAKVPTFAGFKMHIVVVLTVNEKSDISKLLLYSHINEV